MAFQDEFETVDLILNSKAKTRGIDAFSLSLIKAERQIRKIFSFLVYQSSAFEHSDMSNLIAILADARHVYFENIIQGIDKLSPIPVCNLVGNDYVRLKGRLKEATDYRNKIFHGQLTGKNLSRDDLVSLVGDIKQWCKLLSEAAIENFGYDGFSGQASSKRSSFQKSPKNIQLKYTISSIDEYKKFIDDHVSRRR